jgi:hypothetical protein
MNEHFQNKNWFSIPVDLKVSKKVERSSHPQTDLLDWINLFVYHWHLFVVVHFACKAVG